MFLGSFFSFLSQKSLQKRHFHIKTPKNKILRAQMKQYIHLNSYMYNQMKNFFFFLCFLFSFFSTLNYVCINSYCYMHVRKTREKKRKIYGPLNFEYSQILQRKIYFLCCDIYYDIFSIYKYYFYGYIRVKKAV